jgi:error-prone DNA polymerase
MFITIGDETGVAKLMLWPNRYEAQRRLILLATMLARHGKVQREAEVVHVIADRLEDLSGLLRSLGDRKRAWACRKSAGAGRRNWRASRLSEIGALRAICLISMHEQMCI